MVILQLNPPNNKSPAAPAPCHLYKTKKTRPKHLRRVATDDELEEKVVCVTSGVSYLGLAIVGHLVSRGYHVRVIVHNQEDMEKLGEMRSNRITAVLANLMEPENLVDALDGCHGVFHTTSFIDPAGFSGYSKTMAEVEVKATENVMEACAATPTVRKCVLTSSLLACIWRQNQADELLTSAVINHRDWSDESICQSKRLWYALGKLRSEKAAWRVAEKKGLNLTSICAGLVTGPDFATKNPTATIAYLKGAQEMYRSGVLAIVDVTSLAESHVRVYEEMNRSAFGRYICFDKVVSGHEQAQKLAEEARVAEQTITGNGPVEELRRFELSNQKMSNLISRTMMSRCYES
ncbi:unnamed protein product [Rhodiola kirilowii]